MRLIAPAAAVGVAMAMMAPAVDGHTITFSRDFLKAHEPYTRHIMSNKAVDFSKLPTDRMLQVTDFSVLNDILQGLTFVIEGPVDVTDPTQSNAVRSNGDIVCNSFVVDTATFATVSVSETSKVGGVRVTGLDLVCNLDDVTISDVFLLGTLQTAIVATISDATLDIDVTFAGEDLTIGAPTEVATTACNTDLNLDLAFSGGGADWILNLISGLIAGGVTDELGLTLCTEVTTLLDGDLAPTLEQLGRALNAETEATVDVLAPENALTDVPDDVFDLVADPTVSGIFTSVNDFLSRTNENGDLEANDLIQQILNLLVPEGTTPVEGRLNLDLTGVLEDIISIPLGDINITLSLTTIQVDGLTSLEELGVDLAGSYTPRASLLTNTPIDIVVGATLGVVTEAGKTAYPLSLSTGLSNIDAEIAGFIAVKLNTLGDIQLGGIEVAVAKCLLSIFLEYPQVLFNVVINDIVDATVSGLEDAGLQQLVNDILGFAFELYEPAILKGLSPLLVSLLGTTINDAITAEEPLECPTVQAPSGDVVFFDWENEVIAQDVRGFFENTIFPLLSPESISSLIGGSFSLPQTLSFDGIALPDWGLFTGITADTVTLEISSASISGLDTIAELAFLALVQGDNFPYELLFSGAIGTVEKPLVVNADFKIIHTTTEDFSVSASFDTLRGLFQALVKVNRGLVENRQLRQLLDTNCLISLAGSGGEVGITDFAVTFAPTLSLTCNACTAQGLLDAAASAQEVADQAAADVQTFVTDAKTNYDVAGVAAAVAEAEPLCPVITIQSAGLRGPGGNGIVPATGPGVAVIAGGIAAGLVVVGAAGVAVHKKKARKPSSTAQASDASTVEMTNPSFTGEVPEL